MKKRISMIIGLGLAIICLQAATTSAEQRWEISSAPADKRPHFSLSSLSSAALATSTQTNVDHVIGAGLIAFGWVQYDDGILRSITGVNWTLGFSRRHFTAEDGLRPDRFNFYWGWGTMFLLLPYLEVGVTYLFPVANGIEYIGLNMGVLAGGWVLAHLAFDWGWWRLPVTPYIGFSVFF